MNSAVAHYYRQFREGYNYTAEQAYQAARAHIYFRERLAKMVKKPRRRKARKPSN